MNKMKKAMAILSLGLGLSAMLPSMANALPNNSACANLKLECALGDAVACQIYDAGDCAYCEANPDHHTCDQKPGPVG